MNGAYWFDVSGHQATVGGLPSGPLIGLFPLPYPRLPCLYGFTPGLARWFELDSDPADDVTRVT